MKKIIPFILILSFIFPFFLSFSPLVVKADTSSVSDNFGDALENVYKDAIGSLGIVASPEFWEDTSDSIWALICQYYAWPFVSKENTIRQLKNNNISVDQALNDTLNYVLVAIEEQLPYYVYHTLPIDKFFTFYDFSNYMGISTTLGNYQSELESLVSDSDNIYFLSQHGRDFNYLYDTELSSVSMNFLENYALVLYEGSFSVFPDYPFQSIVVRTGDSLPSYNLNGRLKFYNGVSFADTSSIDQWQATSKNGGDNFDHFIKRSVVSIVGPASSDLTFKCGQVNVGSGWFSNASFMGTTFLSVGSSVEILVFKSGSAMNSFYSGNSKFYRFDSDYDLSKYPGIDYDRLFSIISANVDKASGSIGEKLNFIVNEYLEKEIELLGDINDALRDTSGLSWLRRIYELLYDELVVNPSAPGGGSSSPSGPNYTDALNTIHQDLFNLNLVANLIYANLLLSPGGDEEPDFDDLLTVMSTKMPFCLVSDVVTVITIFNAEPVKPDLYFTVPFQPGETWSLDLSFYDGIRPYVHAILCIGFVIFLIRLTMKMYESLKG